MKKNWWFRFTFLCIITIFSILYIIPSFVPISENSKYPFKSKINLGLDLQGGLYIILGIDFVKVYKDEIKNFMKRVQQDLKNEEVAMSLGEPVGNDPRDPAFSVKFTSKEQLEAAKTFIKKYYSTNVRITQENISTFQLTYALHQTYRKQIEEQSVSKSIEVIRNRIDEFGVSEPEIVSQGQDRIVVALPGVKDVDRAKNLIGQTAKLEFKLVHKDMPMSTITKWLEAAAKADITFKKGQRYSEYVEHINQYIKATFKDEVPEGYMLAFQKNVSKKNNEAELEMPYLIEITPHLTGEDLQDAMVTYDTKDGSPIPSVSMTLKSGAAKRFEDLSGNNIGRQLAIVLDNNVVSAPSFSERIGGGQARISMGRGDHQALLKSSKDLALVLRAGALPVQLDFLEQRIVGPGLGQDSIKKAEFSALVGVVIIFLFIIIYYQVSGVMAVISLSINVLLIVACLVGLDATLTLPGIAGIALTVGMAIDASIIIYERIREEIKRGVSHAKSVETGFASAFWTILDSNITTAAAGFFLLNFGTGPIRGFAVTLLIGIAATVYTAYFAGHLMFEWYVAQRRGRSISI